MHGVVSTKTAGAAEVSSPRACAYQCTSAQRHGNGGSDGSPSSRKATGGWWAERSADRPAVSLSRKVVDDSDQLTRREPDVVSSGSASTWG